MCVGGLVGCVGCLLVFYGFLDGCGGLLVSGWYYGVVFLD